ncbi:hypothetical protein EVAR_102408_1 [Eumeta japonica]|uniref:Uncharacterized protein n=1 Tax=Eumeta variegata TaxID=151549 RepID=A0A4C1YWH5_EUMVA|nr:hypothetical protein EVAR_102408_1 [Eumeta japonica]
MMKEFIVDTDASHTGIGGVSPQIKDDRKHFHKYYSDRSSAYIQIMWPYNNCYCLRTQRIWLLSGWNSCKNMNLSRNIEEANLLGMQVDSLAGVPS